MFKILQSVSMTSSPSAKCAEIFCQSPTNFTIICVFCAMKTFELDDFILHFKNVHFENNLLQMDSTKFVETSSFNMNTRIETNKIHKEIMPERLCPGNASTCIGSVAASSNIEESKPEGWECTKCDTSSANGDDDWIESNPKKSNDAPGYDDDHDDYDDEEYKPKRRYYTQHHKKYQCDECEKRYKTEGILKHHIKKYHSDEKFIDKHQCSHCPQVLPNLRQLNSHIVKEHLGFQCQQCNKKFRANYELKRHEITHTGIKNFVCDFENCGKRFYTRRRLTAHRHIHADPKNFVCEKCGYSCRNRAMLKLHCRTHTGEKPYACNLCDKHFASASLLKEHKPIHSTERPHICDTCGATFSRKKALYHHKHLHLGIKKFKCKLCGNAYAQAAGLAGHMRQHKQSAMILSAL